MRKEFGPTRKKKNTYNVQVEGIISNSDLFSLCKSTPLVVVKLNGTPRNQNGGFLTCTRFPNPFASDMTKTVKTFKSIMGEKLSTTIIEYMDKETGQTVATLFPTGLYIHDGYEHDYMAHLNHASRRDLAHQLALRQELIEKYMSKYR